MPSDLPSIRVTLTEAQRNRLKEISKQRSTSQSALIRVALREYLATLNAEWPDDPEPPGQHLKTVGGNAIRPDS